MAEPGFPFGIFNKTISGRVKKIINNAKWLTLFALFGRASWLISLLLFGRAVGPALFGEFSVYIAFWLIASRFLGLGLEIWVNKSIASNRKETERLKITAIAQRLRVMLVGIGYSLILAGSYFLPEALVQFSFVFLLLALRQFAESLREVQVGVLQGREEMKLQAIALIPWDLAQLILVLFCVMIAPMEKFFLLVLLLTLVSFGKIATLRTVIRKHTPSSPKIIVISFLEYQNAARESFLFGFGMLLAIGFGKVDILLLKHFSSPEMVGNYSMAYLFLNACGIILGIVRQALFPSLAHFSSSAKDKFIQLASQSSLVFFLSGLVGAVLLGAIGPMLLRLTGSSFTYAPHLLVLLACSLPWIALTSILGNAINAGGLIKKGVCIQLIGLLSNIAANFYWIPQYGGAGAAYAMLLASSVTALGYALILRVVTRQNSIHNK